MSEREPVKLFVGLPTYDGRRVNSESLIQMLMGNNGKFPDATIASIQTHFRGSSALTANFNELLCDALNARDAGLRTHFLLLHDDIVPQGEWWLQTFLKEFLDNDAWLMSAIVPIKDARGVTSTGIDTDSKWSPKRFTMKEIHAMPKTFTHPNLVLNTGMMMIDLTKVPPGADRPWVDNLCFHIDNAVQKGADGRWECCFEPEDWKMTRDARRFGVPHDRIFATRVVDVYHRGGCDYSSAHVWGADEDKKGVTK